MLVAVITFTVRRESQFPFGGLNSAGIMHATKNYVYTSVENDVAALFASLIIELKMRNTNVDCAFNISLATSGR